MEILRTHFTNERRPNTKAHSQVATNLSVVKGKTKENTTPIIPENFLSENTSIFRSHPDLEAIMAN
jgi:hypothetical protein